MRFGESWRLLWLDHHLDIHIHILTITWKSFSSASSCLFYLKFFIRELAIPVLVGESKHFRDFLVRNMNRKVSHDEQEFFLRRNLVSVYFWVP